MSKETDKKTKLVIKSVEFGITPYGAGNGTHAVKVEFDEVEGTYSYEEPKEPKKDGSIWTNEEIAAFGLMQDVIKLLEEKDYGKEWSKFLLARNYGYFVGDMLAAPEHRDVSEKFFDLIDSTSLASQIKWLKDVTGITEEDKLKAEYMKRLTAPLTTLVTKPLHFTGKDDFYQRFRFIVCKYPLGKEYLKEHFNDMSMAIVEIANHNFAVGIFDFDGDTKEYFESYKDIYKDGEIITLPGDRIFVVDHKGDKDLAKFAFEKGYRLNRALDYGDGISFKL